MFNPFDAPPPSAQAPMSLDEMRRKKAAEAEAHKMLNELLGSVLDSIIAKEDGEMPDEKLIPMRIVRALDKFRNLLMDNFFAYAENLRDDSAEMYAVRKDVLDYLELALAGAQSFLEAHPLHASKE